MTADGLDPVYLEDLRNVELTPGDGPRPPRFVLLTIAEVEMIPPPTFLVDGIIPEAAACELHGPPGGGKTFLSLDLGLSVGSGASFFGHPVKQGHVVYVIGEGQSGMGARIRAWKAARQMFGEILFSLVPNPVQLLQASDLEQFVAAIAAALPDQPVLIVLDTLARCFMGGEENSARDMGLAVAAVDALRKRTGASILLVHHTRKAGDEERGSIALRGGMDTMLSLKGEDGRMVLHCDKQKDAREFADINLTLAPSLDSMVFSLPGQYAGPSRTAIAALEQLIQDFPTEHPTASQWEKAADSKKTNFWKIRGELLRAGYVAEEKEGRTKRYAPTPAGKMAVVLYAKNDAPADRFNRFTIGSEGSAPPAEVTMAGGGGAFRPPPTAVTESSEKAVVQQVHKVHDRFGVNNGTSEAELFAHIEERRAIQYEASADVWDHGDPADDAEDGLE